jgi:hypothetical protein
MGSKSSQPAAPDYAAAAQAAADSNLQMAQYATRANRVNQYSPNGSITYTPPATANGAWSVTTALNPGLQKLYDQNQQTDQTLGNIYSGLANQAKNALANPLSMDGMQQIHIGNNGSPEQFNNDAANAAYANATQYLTPQLAQQKESLDAQLANQGITPGSQAYNNAMQQFNANSNQRYQSAQNNAYLAGQTAGGQNYQNNLAGNNQTYNQQLQLQQNQLANAKTLQGNALGLMGSAVGLEGANPVTSPTLLNLPQQQTTNGADYLGGAQALGGYNQSMYNTQANIGNNNLGHAIGMMGPMMNLAGLFMP